MACNSRVGHVERNAEGTERHPLVGMGVLVMRGNRVLLDKRLGAHGVGYYAASQRVWTPPTGSHR